MVAMVVVDRPHGEQAADAAHGVDVRLAVFPVAAGAPLRVEQVLLFVVAQQPFVDAGPAGQLTDAHVILLTDAWGWAAPVDSNIGVRV